MELINPYYQDLVLIGEEADLGKAWVFTSQFYYGEGGGYIMYVAEYHLQNKRWVLVKRGYADEENNSWGYFDDMEVVTDYITNSPDGIYAGDKGFKHKIRIGSLDELGVESPRQEPNAFDDMNMQAK